ncbi:MAG: diguanylate cyclase [Syntrophomonadaceae bacterium]|nr:diguanylate cyclase [Syntrophomonadaceae bacterium]
MRKKLNILIYLIFILLVLLCLNDYSKTISYDLKQRTYDILQEEGSLQARIIRAKLAGQYHVLESLAEYLKEADYLHTKSMDDISLLMQSVVETGDYHFVYITDIEGRVTASNGEQTSVADRSYFQQSLKGERAIERLEEGRVDYLPHFVISVPVYSGDEIAGVLFGGFKEEVFYEVMILEEYEDTGYCVVTDGQGEIVIKSPNELFLSSDINVLEFFSAAELDNQMTVEKILADLVQGESSGFFYSYNGNRRYTTYIPLGVNDWYIFNVMPASVVETQAERSTELMLLLTGKLMLLTLLLVGYLIAQHRRYTRRLEEEKERLRQSEETYRMVEDLSDSILFEGAVYEDTIHFNQSFYRVFGRTPFMSRLSDLKRPNPYVHEDDNEAFMKLGMDLYSSAQESTAEFRIVNVNREYVWCRVEVLAQRDIFGHPYRVLGKIVNIDQQKREMQQLQIMAERDSLTGLYNHEAMRLKTEDCIANEGKEGYHALFLLDIDEFKAINDTMGHFAGDEVLIGLAHTMKRYFRTTDIVGRLGGDEFAVFLKDMVSESMVRAKAKELCELVNTLKFESCEQKVSISLGVATYSRHGATFDELYRNADYALYRAKEQGKNRFVMYGDRDETL